MKALSWVAEAAFSLFPHMAERELVSSPASSYKGTNPIHEGSTLLSYLLLTGPTSMYHHSGD